MDITIPAPTGSTDSAAPQVTTQNADEVKVTTPQAETPAGTEETEQTASGEDPSQDDDPDKPKTWKEKKKERDRARYQEFKAARNEFPVKLALLEREVAALKGTPPPDFSQIADPTEEIAQRAAHAVRQQTVQDRQQQIETEKSAVAFDQQQKMFAAWDEARQEARERIPDFDAVVTDALPIHQRAAPHIVESDKAAEIAYYLGKNPQVAQSLYQQFETSPARALIELGKIEARLAAPKAKTISTAPKPAPILGGGVNPLSFDPGKSSVSDMEAHLRKAGIIR